MMSYMMRILMMNFIIRVLRLTILLDRRQYDLHRQTTFIGPVHLEHLQT